MLALRSFLLPQDYDTEDIAFLKSAILDQWDVNNDGKINKSELTMLLLHQVQHNLFTPFSHYKNLNNDYDNYDKTCSREVDLTRLI